MKFKKILKIIVGIFIFLTLPSLILFGFVYFKYNEDLPSGTQGEQADALAFKMLNALNYEAYQNTNYLEWTFRKRHHYEWNKKENTCTVFLKDYKVDLHLNDNSQSKVYVQNFIYNGEKEQEIITEATNYFNNDSFWLVAPYKVFDEGTERRLVTIENGDSALLVTYTTGGTTPGDSFLWMLNDLGKPTSYKMWTSSIPIGGLEASWIDWVATESGAQLPTFHKVLFLNLEMGNVKGIK